LFIIELLHLVINMLRLINNISGCSLMVGDKVIPVTGKRITNSKLFSDLLDCYVDMNTIPFPDQFSDIIGIYIRYLKCNTTTIYKLQQLQQSLKLYHFIQDDEFLKYCIISLFKTWSNKRKSMVDKLHPDLQRDIYLHFLLVFIPQSFTYNENFFNTWIALNDRKKIQIKQQTYSSYLHDCNNTRELLSYKSKDNTTFQYHGPLYRWICVGDNKYQLTHRATYEHGSLNGPVISWYSDGCLMSIATFVEGSLHGARYAYFNDRGTIYEQNWKHGYKHIIEKSWYLRDDPYVLNTTTATLNIVSIIGQLRSEDNYECGEKCGTYRGYYSSGQMECEYNFREGIRSGVFKHWNEQRQLLYDVIIDDNNRNRLHRVHRQDNLPHYT